MKENTKEEREQERRSWRDISEEKFWEYYVAKVRNNRRRKKCLVIKCMRRAECVSPWKDQKPLFYCSQRTRWKQPIWDTQVQRGCVILWAGFYWLRTVNTAGVFRTGNESLSYTERGEFPNLLIDCQLPKDSDPRASFSQRCNIKYDLKNHSSNFSVRLCLGRSLWKGRNMCLFGSGGSSEDL